MSPPANILRPSAPSSSSAIAIAVGRSGAPHRSRVPAAFIIALPSAQRMSASAQHAITPYDTILYTPPPELKAAFDGLLAERLIRKEGHAYYWLDLRAYEAAIELRRRKLVPVAIAVSVLLTVVAMLFYAG